MSEYDDDDGPGDEEQLSDMAKAATAATPDEPPAGTFTATVSRGELVALVAQRFYSDLVNRHYHVDGGLAHAVKEEIGRIVQEAGEAKIRELVEAEVLDVVSDLVARGWKKTDSYGRDAGNVTIREMVIAQLTHKDNNYSRSEPLISEMAKAIVEAEIKRELAPLIEQAKVKARAVLEENFAGALKRALLEGAGLRG